MESDLPTHRALRIWLLLPQVPTSSTTVPESSQAPWVFTLQAETIAMVGVAAGQDTCIVI